MRKRTRLVAVGAAIGIVACGSGVAVAATSDSGAPTGAAAKKSCVVVKAGSDKSASVKAAFKKAGVTDQTGTNTTAVALKAALRDVQAASKSLTSPASVAVFARDLHISASQAQKFLQSVRIVKGSGAAMAATLPQSAVHDLATGLGVSDDRARQVLAGLASTNKTEGDLAPGKPGYAGFTAIAKSVGATPQQLSAALQHMKRSLVAGEACRP